MSVRRHLPERWIVQLIQGTCVRKIVPFVANETSLGSIRLQLLREKALRGCGLVGENVRCRSHSRWSIRTGVLRDVEIHEIIIRPFALQYVLIGMAERQMLGSVGREVTHFVCLSMTIGLESEQKRVSDRSLCSFETTVAEQRVFIRCS